MAETFRFSLVSPERQLISEEVEQVIVPGADGEFTVLPRHAPIMTTIKPGVVRVRAGAGSERRIVVFGGFAEMGAEGLTILAEQAIPAEELRPDQIEQEIRNAGEDVADARDDAARLKAQTRLDQLRTLQDAALTG
jgi:F-type H+-transporting ATPase subunit epsilon